MNGSAVYFGLVEGRIMRAEMNLERARNGDWGSPKLPDDDISGIGTILVALANLALILVVAAAIRYAFLNAGRIFEALKTWALNSPGLWAPLVGGVAVVAIGYALYGFKQAQQIWYGRVELAFAVAVGALTMEQFTKSKGAWFMAFAGAVYIFVRGACNIKDGAEKRIEELEAESERLNAARKIDEQAKEPITSAKG